MLIALKEHTGIPLYVQIYQCLKKMILSGQLKAGSRLPSTRALAADLSVGRNTVESAYAQLLVEGYVISRQGSGFFVQNIQGFEAFEKTRTEQQKIMHCPALPDQTSACFRFQYGQLASDSFPFNLWKKLTVQALHELQAKALVSYGGGKGEYGLRQEICRYLYRARGIICVPEQVIVCSGTTYALLLLCQILRARFGEIAIEDPGYINAREVLQKSGFTLRPIPVQKDGLDIGKLESCGARVIYTTPSHQFPSGAVMSIQKRNQLLNWTEKVNGIIIEDDYDSEFRYHTKPVPSIAGTYSGANVIYMGTMSKILSPALRISYLVLPKQLVNQYDAWFSEYPSSVSAVEQKALELFMGSEHWETHLRRICTSTRRKHDMLIQLIKENFADNFEIWGENAGLHILLRSKNGMTEKELIGSAEKKGVTVYPVSCYWIEGQNYSKDMVLLGFGSLSGQQIREGINLLKQAWIQDR